MRRTSNLVTALVLVLALWHPPAAQAHGPVGPTLQTSSATLAASLHCPATFTRAHNPVLFVHGTTLTTDSNWAWNYGKVLPGEGYDVCMVDLPDRARADIQVSAEYVVHAIRFIASQAQRQVDVVGFSQGPLEPRWAIKFWPDMQNLIGDLVGMSGVAHGFTATDVLCASECIAPFWQMKPNSRFLRALNEGDETPGDIDYTSVYSRTDQFVWLAKGAGDVWTESAKINGASNIAVQDICPGRVVEHVQAIYDAAVYAVIMDALTHDGAADPARVDRAVCAQVAMPGVELTDAIAKTVEIDHDLMVLTGEHHVKVEPITADYAS
jgi:triacylglycerol esterase/lipase EstA (alpha/beta hydrolase family)